MRRARCSWLTCALVGAASVLAQWTLKVFAALVSVGLAATTVLGLYMSWQTTRRRAVLTSGIAIVGDRPVSDDDSVEPIPFAQQFIK